MSIRGTVPQRQKPGTHLAQFSGTTEVVPFQNPAVSRLVGPDALLVWGGVHGGGWEREPRVFRLRFAPLKMTVGVSFAECRENSASFGAGCWLERMRDGVARGLMWPGDHVH